MGVFPDLTLTLGILLSASTSPQRDLWRSQLGGWGFGDGCGAFSGFCRSALGFELSSIAERFCLGCCAEERKGSDQGIGIKS